MLLPIFLSETDSNNRGENKIKNFKYCNETHYFLLFFKTYRDGCHGTIF